MANGSREAVVELRTLEEPFAEPPNPYYLKVHAAFAKVMGLIRVRRCEKMT